MGLFLTRNHMNSRGRSVLNFDEAFENPNERRLFLLLPARTRQQVTAQQPQYIGLEHRRLISG